MNSEKTGALVLAAGMSTRMKGYKPLLDLGGISIIKRVILSLKQAGADPLILITGYRGKDLREHLQGEEIIFVENPGYADGDMFGSVRLGLEAAEGRCGRILVVPGDVPLISEDTIKKVMESEGWLVRPVCGGKPGHPVMIHMDLAEGIRSFKGDGGLKKAMESLGVPIEEIRVEDRGIYLDADTPEEYARLQQMIGEKNSSGHIYKSEKKC